MDYQTKHRLEAIEHTKAAILSLRAAVVNLEAAKMCMSDRERRDWLQAACNAAEDAISEAEAAIEPKA